MKQIKLEKEKKKSAHLSVTSSWMQLSFSNCISRSTFSNFVMELSTSMTWSTINWAVQKSPIEGMSAPDSWLMSSDVLFRSEFCLRTAIACVCNSICCRFAMACDRLSSEPSLQSPCCVIWEVETRFCECESGIVTSSRTFSIIRHGSVSLSSISVESSSSLSTFCVSFFALFDLLEVAFFMAFMMAVRNDWWRCGEGFASKSSGLPSQLLELLAYASLKKTISYDWENKKRK